MVCGPAWWGESGARERIPSIGSCPGRQTRTGAWCFLTYTVKSFLPAPVLSDQQVETGSQARCSRVYLVPANRLAKNLQSNASGMPRQRERMTQLQHEAVQCVKRLTQNEVRVRPGPLPPKLAKTRIANLLINMFLPDYDISLIFA